MLNRFCYILYNGIIFLFLISIIIWLLKLSLLHVIEKVRENAVPVIDINANCCSRIYER